MRIKFLTIGLGVLLAVAVISAAVAFAQTPQVAVGQAFDLRGAHNGANTTSFTLAITGPNAYNATLPVSALSGGYIVFAVPGRTTAGTYSAIITAVGPGGSTPSVPFAFVVQVVAPAAVTGIELIPR